MTIHQFLSLKQEKKYFKFRLNHLSKKIMKLDDY